VVHNLYCITNNKQYDITPITGLLTWKSSIDQLGVQLDFEIAYNDDRYFPVNPVDIGSMIVLAGQAEIFRGIVVTEQKTGRGAVQYTCFDPAFYLNQSKAIYQFKGMAADGAIKKVLGDFGVPVGGVAGMPTLITQIYNDKIVADIIRDILDRVEKETGAKHRMEMRAGKLHIEKQTDLLIKPTFKLAENLAEVPVTAAISNPTRRRSIEEMRNSIKIVSEDNVVGEAKNDGLIKQYGLLQEVQSIDKKDTAQAKQIAQNLLKDLGRIMEENSIEVPGHDDVRAGRLIEVEEPVTGMTGRYLVKDVAHTVRNGIHTMQLGLGVM